MVIAAAGSSHCNVLLSLLISLLEVLDAVQRWLCTIWYCLTHGTGPAKAGGTNPPPPAVVGIIIAEPNAEDISLHMVANLAGWCMAYDSIQQLHLYEPSGQLKRSRPQLEQKLAAIATREGRNLVIKCGWSVSKPSSWASAFEQQQKRQQRLATGQNQQAAHPAQQRSWSVWLTLQIVGSGKKQQDTTTPQHDSTEQRRLAEDNRATPCQSRLQQQGVSCSSIRSNEQQQPQAEETSTCATAGNAGSSSSKNDHGACAISHTPTAAAAVPGAQPSAAAVSVRILSAEDAFLPVIEAAADRCRICELPTSLPQQQHWLQDHEQKQQQHQQNAQQRRQQQKQHDQMNGVQNNSMSGCHDDPSCSCSVDSIHSCSCHDGVKPVSETGMAYGCQQQRYQVCSTPGGNHCNCGNSNDRLAAVALHTNVQHQQQKAGEQQVATVADSSIQALQQQQQQQDVCNESTKVQSGQEQCLQRSHLCLERTCQHQSSQLQVATANLQQVLQHKPQQKQPGNMLPELAAVSSPDIAQEPQLLLVFGPALTLAGYPPFHTRAAEVHYMGRLSQADRHAVVGAIASYCKVLQRHGA